MSKCRTKPFTSENSAKLFANVVGGKVTQQGKVHHVHYKSDGVYRGSKVDFNSELNSNETHWHTYDDI